MDTIGCHRPISQSPGPDEASVILKPRKAKRIIGIAPHHLSLKIRERRSDNVPRLDRGRGRIAPYSIGAAWCVAFGTWIWRRVGLTDYMRTGLTWRSHDRTLVAIQVHDLSKWSRRTRHRSGRAEPGFMVAYSRNHVGVVTRVNRKGRAVWAIEGNKDDGVRKVRVPMRKVTGYLSPVRIPEAKVSVSAVKPDMPAARAAAISQAVLDRR